MDIITHGLIAYTLCKLFKVQTKSSIIVTIVGSLIPDVGEITIQNELSSKFGEFVAVYDERTSDVLVASNLNVTFLYDILHSLILPIILLTISLIVSNINTQKQIQYFSLGIISHIFLDSFTHGKVWALKLLFPISNSRFQIFPNLVGNWWDWKPKLPFLLFELPVYCFLIWVGLILILVTFKF